MQFIIALAAAVLIGVLLWKAVVRQPPDGAPRMPRRSASARRMTAPDDDPEFLRQLGEQTRRPGEDPPNRH